MGRWQGDALTQDASKLEFIDDFIYLGSVISNEDGFKFKEMLRRQRNLSPLAVERARGVPVLVYHSKSTKIMLYDNCVN